MRVCLVTLQGEGKFEITQSKYRLTEDQKQDDGQKLFDFCAECLKTFIDTNFVQEDGSLSLKQDEVLPLGFTVRLHYTFLWSGKLIIPLVLIPLLVRPRFYYKQISLNSALAIVRKRLIMEFSSAGPKASERQILRVSTLLKCSANLLRNT